MVSDILDSFCRYFEMVPALSERLKQEAYKLRYQVYCLETGFENARACPGGLERDEYDSYSAHYLIRHRKSMTFAATTRLILPSGMPFPVERHTQITDSSVPRTIPREYLAEASRFCVSKAFKKRQHEAGTLAGIDAEQDWVLTEDERRIFPHLTVALFACLIKMSDDHNIRYWYAAMEPALVRYFTTLGIYFSGIGPIVEYHGQRRPYLIKVSDLLDGVAQKNTHLWNMMTSNGTVGHKLSIND